MYKLGNTTLYGSIPKQESRIQEAKQKEWVWLFENGFLSVDETWKEQGRDYQRAVNSKIINQDFTHNVVRPMGAHEEEKI